MIPKCSRDRVDSVLGAPVPLVKDQSTMPSLMKDPSIDASYY